jgi:riboflavin biosynthesis pyrimidine reductase
MSLQPESRKLVLKMHTSLDGFVATEDGDVQWLFEHFDDEVWEWEVERLIPKVVFSKSLVAADWTDTHIERGDLADGITALKREAGKDVLAHGGAGFAQSLSREGLIDEYRQVVHPVALGAGLRLFSSPTNLELRAVHRFPAGAVALTYNRA